MGCARAGTAKLEFFGNFKYIPNYNLLDKLFSYIMGFKKESPYDFSLICNCQLSVYILQYFSTIC